MRHFGSFLTTVKHSDVSKNAWISFLNLEKKHESDDGSSHKTVKQRIYIDIRAKKTMRHLLKKCSELASFLCCWRGEFKCSPTDSNTEM